MELSNVVALWSAAMGTLQGIGAYFGLLDRREKNRAERTTNSKFNPLAVSVLLTIGTIVTIAFGCWMFFAKPLRPTEKIVVKTVTVEKPTPCPPTLQRNGAASAKANGGGSANAHSGNGDTYYAPPSPPSKPPH